MMVTLVLGSLPPWWHRHVLSLLLAAAVASCSDDGRPDAAAGGIDASAIDAPSTDGSDIDACSCEAPTTKEGLPCACDYTPTCSRLLCPQGEIRGLVCTQGKWAQIIEYDVGCSGLDAGAPQN
jgi:hypothetical protein